MNEQAKKLDNALNVIITRPVLLKQLKSKYKAEIETIRTACISGFISNEAVDFINNLVPTCFKIGDKVFLLGSLNQSYHYSHCHELYNMTTEMETGTSYSLYVSGFEYFEFASPDEHIQVKDFLNTLK